MSVQAAVSEKETITGGQSPPLDTEVLQTSLLLAPEAFKGRPWGNAAPL
jgi:hypothetical protein